MNTLQLKRALEHNTFTKKIFGGVFAADELPKTFDTFPCGFVANTDPSTEPGVVLSQHNTTGSDVTSSNPYSPATYGARDVTSGGIVLRRNKGLTLTPGGTTTGSDVTIHVQAYKCLVVINTIVS